MDRYLANRAKECINKTVYFLNQKIVRVKMATALADIV